MAEQLLVPQGWAGLGVQRLGQLLQENSPNSHRESLFPLFLFEKFLLLKPATPYKGLTSHTAPLSNRTWDYPGQGPTQPSSPQLVSIVSEGVHSPCVFATSSLFPSLPLQATRSFPVLLKSCLAGEGAVDLALSQEPCSRPGGHRTWSCSHPCPHAGPRYLIVLKHSPYCLVFQCPL